MWWVDSTASFRFSKFSLCLRANRDLKKIDSVLTTHQTLTNSKETISLIFVAAIENLCRTAKTPSSSVHNPIRNTSAGTSPSKPVASSGCTRQVASASASLLRALKPIPNNPTIKTTRTGLAILSRRPFDLGPMGSLNRIEINT